MSNFGEFFKQKRISLGKTLRQFYQEHDLDPGNTSKMERGILPAPAAEEKLKEYAKYLNIKRYFLSQIYVNPIYSSRTTFCISRRLFQLVLLLERFLCFNSSLCLLGKYSSISCFALSSLIFNEEAPWKG